MSELIGKTLKGRSKSILIDDDAITISYRNLYHGPKGDKRIPYQSITAVQFREPGWLIGYLQFSVKGALEARDPVQDENAIEFDKPADQFRELRDLIHRKIAAAGVPPPAPALVADELAKLASLRDRGILTDDEFAFQKAKLLK